MGRAGGPACGVLLASPHGRHARGTRRRSTLRLAPEPVTRLGNVAVYRRLRELRQSSAAVASSDAAAGASWRAASRLRCRARAAAAAVAERRAGGEEPSASARWARPSVVAGDACCSRCRCAAPRRRGARFRDKACHVRACAVATPRHSRCCTAVCATDALVLTPRTATVALRCSSFACWCASRWRSCPVRQPDRAAVPKPRQLALSPLAQALALRRCLSPPTPQARRCLLSPPPASRRFLPAPAPLLARFGTTRGATLESWRCLARPADRNACASAHLTSGARGRRRWCPAMP